MRHILDFNGQKHPIDGDYPYGDIKDDDGTNDGTDMDTTSFGDIFQFFMRLADKGIGLGAINHLPDNAYSGFQLFQSFLNLTAGTLVQNTIALLNGFTLQSSQKAQYRVDGMGNVFINANITTPGAQIQWGLLPAALWPKYTKQFIVPCNPYSGQTNYANCQIRTDGTLVVSDPSGANAGVIGANNPINLSVIYNIND
jgi:hypothetical protein